MPATYDAVVIGAGVIGASIGFELAKRGYRTLNIDKLPAAGYGSTGNSCAIVRVHYSTFDGVALAREGFFYWMDWENHLGARDERGFAKYLNVGCVVFKTPHNHNLVNVCRHLDALKIAYEDWDVATLEKKMPYFDARSFWPPRRLEDPDFGAGSGRIAGAIFTPDAGYVSDPQLANHNVQRAAEAKGAEFRFNAKVVEISRRGNRVQGVVLADGTRIDAAVVVNVAGPHSYLVNRMAGVEEGMTIKTRALRQEVVHVPAPRGISYPHVVSDGDAACYSRPETGGHILIGSEDPECDQREWVDPDDYDRNLTDQAKVQVCRVAQRMPSLGVPNSLRGIVDLYDVSDDWIPIYDKSDLGGFYMAIGTSGNQFKNAPVVGVMMAELIQACENGRDHDAMPLELPLTHCGVSVNVGFYSRQRKINPESSFSVIG